MKRFMIASMVVLAFFFFYSSGTGSTWPQDPTPSEDKGIGPIKRVELGPLDQKLAAEGKTIFEATCVSCHSLDKRAVGPPLRNIAKEQTPEFIMNFILNTTEMAQKDPVIKKLIAEYGTIMPQPSINEKQARAILEYFRSL